MTTEDSKTCAKCGATRPRTDFCRDKQRKDGRYPYCKACVAIYAREYGAKNRAALQAKQVKYRDKKAAYWQVNKTRFKAIARAKEAALPAAERKRLRRARSARNNENARARAIRAGVEREMYTRREIYDRDGGKCRLCRTPLDPKAKRGFHIDHIVPLMLGGPDTRANVQLTCPSCNCRKSATLRGQVYLPV